MVTYVKKLRNKTDYCNICSQLQIKLRCPSITTEDKEEAKNELLLHKELALSARKAYADHHLIVAKEEGYCVLSFDFAENILVPALVNQPGSFYFHSRRKIDVFGITNENTGQQLNFLIDENCKLKKGPNMVLSMLHYYIFKHVEPGKTVILYADNCPGQNKNQTVVAYLCYLVQILK